jgi:hypothetical protein
MKLSDIINAVAIAALVASASALLLTTSRPVHKSMPSVISPTIDLQAALGADRPLPIQSFDDMSLVFSSPSKH